MDKKGMLICFIGIDGSGKTTIAKNVSEKLKENGIECQYLYGRVNPVVSRFLMWVGRKFLLKRKKRSIFHEYNEYTTQKKRVLKSNIFSKTFIYSLLFDQVIQANIKIKPYLLVKKIVICDRYIFDTVITDISANLDYSGDETINLINKLFRMVPKPDAIFLIDVPEEIAYSRKNDVPHINYLKERRNLYLNVTKAFEVTTLDGTKSINEISKYTYTYIKSILEGTKHGQ